MPNRLAVETSTYLRQHADNPVDWYPWGAEALERAKTEDRPIFLSVGYSACHWCHVMARESFQDPKTASIMNRNFINIKVDREERPDLDRIYMNAVVAMTGNGGWPMSVFLTPDGAPFYGGTYFPPVRRFGMPSFPEVLLSVAEAWESRRADIVENAGRLVEMLSRSESSTQVHATEPSPHEHATRPQPEQSTTISSGLRRQETLDPGLQDRVLRRLCEGFDWRNGGWGGAPKFPQPMVLEFLLAYHRTASDDTAWRMASLALESMARGGIYDQLGGGFHRYSVDAQWHVPHFEKMLYDNAQLARVYLHAWQTSREQFFKTICEEILDYLLREMTGPQGEFFSTQDADSEGEEGKFFLWRVDEVSSALGEAGLSSCVEGFLSTYTVSQAGNASSEPSQHFEGKNILRFMGEKEERAALAAARRTLLKHRLKRVPPGRDEKVLASWNGLALAAFAEAGVALSREDYMAAAERNAGFLSAEMCEGGHLYHTWTAGRPKQNGYLEDYSGVLEGLLSLYQAKFDSRWYAAAVELAGFMLKHFAAETGFFDTSDDHESLILRPRELQDNAVPSGNSMAATVLLKLAGLSRDLTFAEVAHSMLASTERRMAEHPLAFGQWLVAFGYAVSRPLEIALVGRRDAPDTMALLEVCRQGYRPHQVIALCPPGGSAGEVPLLKGRAQVNGLATAYVCRDFTCLPPVTDPKELEDVLG